MYLYYIFTFADKIRMLGIDFIKFDTTLHSYKIDLKSYKLLWNVILYITNSLIWFVFCIVAIQIASRIKNADEETNWASQIEYLTIRQAQFKHPK